MSRCAICNREDGHSVHCTRYQPPVYAPDERRPPTSAERYADLHLPGHEEEQHRAAYGRADADIAPSRTYGGDTRVSHERYYPLDRPLPLTVLEAECDCGVSPLAPREDHLLGCPVEIAWAAEQTPDERSTAIAGVSGLDPVADARARAATEGLNPKDLVGAVKTPLGLLPWTGLVQVAGVFAKGAEKYGAYNWRTPGQPVQHVTYVAAAFRHLAAYMDGQTLDPETGCNHLAHAACGLLILLDASAVGNAIDNRPTPGVAAEIMAANLRT